MVALHPCSRTSALLLLLAFAGCRGTPSEEPGAAAVALTTDAPAAVAAAPEVAVDPASVRARVIELGRADNRVQEQLERLCIDIGPRLTGSSQLQRAVEWARDEFERYGLTARLEQWGEFPVGFDRGEWRGAMVAPVEMPLEMHTMAWTPGTNGPARGPALPYPATAAELDALRPRLSGAWLVRRPTAEKKDASGGLVFAKPEQPSNELVREVQAALVEHGALGEVRGARGELLVTDGDHRIEWEELPRLVSVRIVREQHDELWRRIQAGEAVELEFDVDNRFVQGPIPQYNVVADLVGSEKPDEYVIVCGHLDSWDGAQGVVDNGTGCATTLEAARLLARTGARPARTIRFVLWTGEEQGLFGSEKYVEQHAGELPRISAVLNHDGGTNWLSGLAVTPAMMPAMRQACAPVIGLDPELTFELSETDGLPSSVGSDNDSFVRVGVPGFFWRQSGRSEYDHHHHTQFDTFDAAIPEYQRHSAMVAALVAFEIANLPELLDRTNMKAPEPRRMGVQLDGTRVTEVTEGSRAAAAGVRTGDVILAIDGVEAKTQGTITGATRGGGSVKVVKVQRGEETLELTLDWSDDPDEPRRLKQIEARAKREAERRAEREARRAAGEPDPEPRPE